MLNVKDLSEYTNKINAAIDDAMANNGTQDSPAVDELISYYTAREQDSTGTRVKENSASQKDGARMKRETSLIRLHAPDRQRGLSIVMEK